MPVTLKSRLPAIAAQLGPRVDAAMKAGAEEIAEQARQRVPVDEGTLRDAIHIERRGTTGYYVVAGDDDAFYGHMIEFGTAKAAPRPFLIPAAEEAKDHLQTLVTAALRGL